jgi:hypothetical protein
MSTWRESCERRGWRLTLFLYVLAWLALMGLYAFAVLFVAMPSAVLFGGPPMSDTDERGERQPLTEARVRRILEDTESYRLPRQSQYATRMIQDTAALCRFWLAAHAAPVSKSVERRVAVLKRAEKDR